MRKNRWVFPLLVLLTVALYAQPTAIITDPDTMAVIACQDQRILIILNSDAGVNESSITLIVNVTEYTISDPQLSISDDILEFNPSGEEIFTDGVAIVVLNPFADTLGDSSITYTWHFDVDRTHPAISNESPASGAVMNVLSFDISFDAADPVVNAISSGVDAGTIDVWVNSSAHFTGTDAAVSWDGSHFVINSDDLGINFSDNEEVTVHIRLADLADSAYCGPNWLDTSWTFKIGETPCFRGPNPITPNGDSFNDDVEFRFPNMRNPELASTVYIYDMHTNEVAKIIAPTLGAEWLWDGTDTHGDLCAQGTYLYVVEQGSDIVCNGTITILR